MSNNIIVIPHCKDNCVYLKEIIQKELNVIPHIDLSDPGFPIIIDLTNCSYKSYLKLCRICENNNAHIIC